MLPTVGYRGVSRSTVHGVLLAALMARSLAAPATAAHHARHERKQRRSTSPASRRDSSRGDDGASGGAGTFPPPNPPARLGEPCPGADTAPSVADVAQLRAALLCLINQQRARLGLGAVNADAQLIAAAQQHADDMVAGDYFGHTSPSGKGLRQRAADSGYATPGGHYLIGEDLAWGTYDPTDPQSAITPSAIVSEWMHSASHRAMIVTREFRDAGAGVALAAPARLAGGQPGVTVAIEFGVRG